MQTTIARHQLRIQECPHYQVGDIVTYRGYAMKVWVVLNLSVPMQPTQAPGLFYALQGDRMHAHAYFIVPATEIEAALPLAA